MTRTPSWSEDVIGGDVQCRGCGCVGETVDDVEHEDGCKEGHRLGTINRRDPPEGDWAAKHDWTRYRGPDSWPVPGGWVFKDPEGGGWWEYFGDVGEGHEFDDSILEALKDNPTINDPFETFGDLRRDHGEYAFLRLETANPDEVSRRNPEDEKLEWTLEVAGMEVFSRIEPDRSDLMAAVAEALQAYHAGELEERIEEIVPETGEKPKAVREQEQLEERKENNESLDDFATDGGVDQSSDGLDGGDRR
ncbi:hypothetical protein SAMN05192561_11231 [Halopenitus malekzadehii]|uniref:Uncharacterized protein n=1 Tax=Halopenitus malekzadehii TaxID=1267564 RepID=A0A1H6JEP8_9EURY|nr:hypothetical protein [Halopenitus malekzadehii]SEH60713.1 hypothetical protein SAMN05192561_11231 [Halopenitus malekzadehii]